MRLLNGARAGTMTATTTISDRPQFGLRDVLIATAVLAVVLALVRLVGIFGGLAAFIASVVFMFRTRRNVDKGRRLLALDLIWGIGMPLVCLLLDPMVFQRGRWDLGPELPLSLNRQFDLGPLNLAAYTALGYQMAVLLAWLLWLQAPEFIEPVPEENRRVDFAAFATGVVAGSLAIGLAIACALGMWLALPTLFGILALGLGLPGLTPWFTAWTYFRRMRQAWFRSADTLPLAWFLGSVVLGMALAGGLPVAVAVAASWEA